MKELQAWSDLNKGARKITDKSTLEQAIEVLMNNGDLFFEDYEGKRSPITYVNTEDNKIIFKE